ncbi:hypothetical protein DL98DRAFT_543220 [Cadophora sp. DSE1049]|nr:hypothetical protein DL98DRAFT_543220 [Cadophora sp. DSE1049]
MSTSQQQANNISKLNIAQNHPDFKLEPIENQPLIFKKELFPKTLDPPNSNPEKPENYRTVTIKCLYPNCKKVFKKQRVYHSTSNYITHYKFIHKSFNITRVLNNLDEDDSSATKSSQGSTISTITDIFAKQRANKRPKTPEKEEFNIITFKKLLLKTTFIFIKTLILVLLFTL